MSFTNWFSIQFSIILDNISLRKCWDETYVNFVSIIGMGFIQISVIHDNICKLIYKKCLKKSYHIDMKYHMTLNTIFSVHILWWILRDPQFWAIIHKKCFWDISVVHKPIYQLKIFNNTCLHYKFTTENKFNSMLCEKSQCLMCLLLSHWWPAKWYVNFGKPWLMKLDDAIKDSWRIISYEATMRFGFSTSK